MILEGRNDDRTWTGFPLKNIWTAAATRACVFLGLYNCCFAPLSLTICFHFSLPFPQISSILFSLHYPPWVFHRSSHFCRYIRSPFFPCPPQCSFDYLQALKQRWTQKGKLTERDLRCQWARTGACVVLILTTTTAVSGFSQNKPHCPAEPSSVSSLAVFSSNTHLPTRLCIAHFVSHPPVPRVNLPSTQHRGYVDTFKINQPKHPHPQLK